MNQSVRWANNDFILKKINEIENNSGSVSPGLIGNPVNNKDELSKNETKIGKIVYVIEENSIYVWSGSVWKGIGISDFNITKEEIDKIFA